MDDLSISIFGNKTISEILNEVKLFSKCSIKYYENLNSFNKLQKNNHLIIFFLNNSNKNDYKKIVEYDLPILVINKHLTPKNLVFCEFVDFIEIPLNIFILEKKIVSLLSKFQFNKSSFITLGNYLIDKNERKIKRNDLELQLTEKEISFLILFSKSNKPVSRKFVLKNVWHYSSESDTHTVETHIHRLRKKILEKFNDSNFIKNSNKGYYI